MGYWRDKPNWTLPIALAIVGIALLLLVILVASNTTQPLFGGISENDATLISSVVAALAGMLGIAISGAVGLTLVRRDRYDAELTEYQVLCAALGAELEDISGMFADRAIRFQEELDNLKKSGEATVEIDMTQLPTFSTHVYVSSSDRVGLLGTELVAQVVALYGRTFVWAKYEKRSYSAESLKWTVDRVSELSALTKSLSKALHAESQKSVSDANLAIDEPPKKTESA